MSDNPTGNGRDPKWARLYRTALILAIETAAAILGLYTMYKAISDPVQRPWLYAAAIGMMGIPAAHSLESLAGFLSNLLGALQDYNRRHQELERDHLPPDELRRRDDQDSR